MRFIVPTWLGAMPVIARDHPAPPESGYNRYTGSIAHNRSETGTGMDVLAFQRKWIDASQQKERSAYVTHFNDLCEVLGVPKPLDVDPTGEAYGFE